VTNIHSTAIVSKEARIGDNVEIGPFTIIGPHVEIGNGTKIHSHVTIDGHVKIGENNQFYPYCSIGAPPQDLTYKGEPTRVEIGNNNTFREYVSIHRATMKEVQLTKVGNNGFFMAYVHLAHDTVVGDKCVIANSVNLAGHVHLGDRVIIGGGTNISQFCKLGRGAFIGGASGIDRDIPPFCTAYGNRIKLKGINIIGMRRHGFSKNIIGQVVDFYRLMESSMESFATAPRVFVDKSDVMSEFKGNEIVAEISAFIRQSEVGIAPFM